MRVEITEETAAALGEYASVAIAFEVGAVLDVADSGDGRAGSC